MNILKLIAQLMLDGTRFKAGLREASSASKAWAKDLKNSIKGELAAAFGAAALVAFVKSSIQSVAALKDMADQSRMTTDEVQKFQAAAEDIGLTFSDVAQAERAFNQNRKEAVETNEELRATFAKYGFTLQDLQNPQLRFVDFMNKANAAMQNMSGKELAAAPTELFDMLGKAGPKVQELVRALKEFDGMKLVDEAAILQVDRAEARIREFFRTLRGEVAMSAISLSHLAGVALGRDRSPELPDGAQVRAGTAGMGALAAQIAGQTPDQLFKDTIEKTKAEEQAKQIVADRLKLEEAIFKVRLQQMNAAEQQTAKEKRLQSAMLAIQGLEASGFDASKERAEAVGMLGDLLNKKQQDIGASSMTQIGGWTGRNFVNAPETPMVRAAKDLLIPANATRKAVESIDKKVKAGKTLNATV